MHRYLMVALLGAMLAGCGGPPPPVGISSVTPSSGDVTGGTSVSMAGWGFQDPSEVRFDGILAGSITVVDANTITCTTPAHAAGWVVVQVTVTATGDTAQRVNGFRYIQPPTVSGVSPTFGPTAGGASVTVSGSNFQAGAAVYFGDNPATNVTVVDSGTITCTTPASSVSGAVDVKVVNSDGGEDTLAAAYTYRFPPEMNSVSPLLMDVAGGALTVDGNNFYGSPAVNVGGVAATVNSVALTQIQCTVPEGLAVGYHDVQVINPDAQSDMIAAALFVYDAANSLFVALTGNDTTGTGTFAAPYRTIGKGLAEAGAQGKTLVVLSDTGTGTATYDTERLPLVAPDGVSAYAAGGAVIVDGLGAASAVFQCNLLVQPTLLAGFTLTNAADSNGTGVVVNACSDVTLSRMVIDDCRLGIALDTSTLALDDTTITNNEYAGIVVASTGTLTLNGCVVRGNGLISSGDSEGGVRLVGATSNMQAYDCTFDGNVRRQSSTLEEGGGALTIWRSAGEFVRCVFSNNSAYYGGAVFLQDVDWDNNTDRNRRLFFRNCLFVGNQATGAPKYSTGSSVYMLAWTDNFRGVEFTNCLFEADGPETYGGAVAMYVRKTGNGFDFFAQPIFRNCIFHGSAGAALHARNALNPYTPGIMGIFALWYCGFHDNYHNLSYAGVMYLDTASNINSRLTTPAGVGYDKNVGNIVPAAGAPLFVAAGDYHLATGSPCIDAGDPDTAYNDLDTSRNDMGMYGGPDATW